MHTENSLVQITLVVVAMTRSTGLRDIKDVDDGVGRVYDPILA